MSKAEQRAHRRRVILPLRAKIAAFALLVAVGSSGLLAFFTVYLPWRAALEEQTRRVRQFTKVIISGSAVTAEKGADDRVVRFFVEKSHSMGTDVAWALVMDREGRVDFDRSHVNPRVLASIDPALAEVYAADHNAAMTRIALGAVRGPHRAIPVAIKEQATGEEAGRLVVGFSNRAISDEARRNLLLNLGAFAAVLFIGVFFSLTFSRSVTRPLQRLTAAMERAEEGNLDVSVKVRTGDEVAVLADAFNRMIVGLRERQRLRGTLERYVSHAVADRILSEREDLDMRGEIHQATILFIDIRNFTPLAEKLAPALVVEILNSYFDIIIDGIFKYDGTINKFIGDSVMAVYGAPFDVDEPEWRAVQTAMELQEKVESRNLERLSEGQEIIHVGIGINTGTCIAGNIGSAKRMEYTVIGDDVNLAQRLEAHAREGQVLISQSTFDAVRERVQVLVREPVMVKGKSQPVPIYQVIGLVARPAGVKRARTKTA